MKEIALAHDIPVFQPESINCAGRSLNSVNGGRITC